MKTEVYSSQVLLSMVTYAGANRDRHKAAVLKTTKKLQQFEYETRQEL